MAGFLMLGGAKASQIQEQDRSQKLHAATEQLLAENTACYELTDSPYVVTEDTPQGQRQFIQIPIKDASIHDSSKYRDKFDTFRTDRLTQVLTSNFRAEFTVYGGQGTETPIRGFIAEEPGTKPETTDFNLQLDVLRGDTQPGERVANIYYSADAFEFEDSEHREFVGQRLCGTVGFTVEPDGGVSNLRLIENEDTGTVTIREVPGVQPENAR